VAGTTGYSSFFCIFLGDQLTISMGNMFHLGSRVQILRLKVDQTTNHVCNFLGDQLTISMICFHNMFHLGSRVQILRLKVNQTTNHYLLSSSSFKIFEPLIGLCLTRCVITVSFMQHVVGLSCSFLDFEAEFNTHSLRFYQLRVKRDKTTQS
jgi:hypothetical protein